MDEIFTKLSQLFDKGFDINEELKESSLSTNDTNFQVIWKYLKFLIKMFLIVFRKEFRKESKH